MPAPAFHLPNGQASARHQRSMIAPRPAASSSGSSRGGCRRPLRLPHAAITAVSVAATMRTVPSRASRRARRGRSRPPPSPGGRGRGRSGRGPERAREDPGDHEPDASPREAREETTEDQGIAVAAPAIRAIVTPCRAARSRLSASVSMAPTTSGPSATVAADRGRSGRPRIRSSPCPGRSAQGLASDDTPARSWWPTRTSHPRTPRTSPWCPGRPIWSMRACNDLYVTIPALRRVPYLNSGRRGRSARPRSSGPARLHLRTHLSSGLHPYQSACEPIRISDTVAPPEEIDRHPRTERERAP